MTFFKCYVEASFEKFSDFLSSLSSKSRNPCGTRVSMMTFFCALPIFGSCSALKNVIICPRGDFALSPPDPRVARVMRQPRCVRHGGDGVIAASRGGRRGRAPVHCLLLSCFAASRCAACPTPLCSPVCAHRRAAYRKHHSATDGLSSSTRASAP